MSKPIPCPNGEEDDCYNCSYSHLCSKGYHYKSKEGEDETKKTYTKEK